MLSESRLRELHTKDFRVRDVLKENIRCGCFHCLRQFNFYKIREWTDDGEIAICPFCYIDSVLPMGEIETDIYIDIDETVLKDMKKMFF